MEAKNQLLNKPVIVTKADSFVLYGTLLAMELHGIWLQTTKETSFITYNNIKDIRLDKKAGGI